MHRLVGELARWGMVEPGPAGVHLGMRLFELGQLAPRQRSLREAALPYLNDLHEATHETVHLAVLEGTGALEVVHLEKLTGRGGPALSPRVGGRMPAYCTAVGRALLAFSPASTVEAVLDAGSSASPRTRSSSRRCCTGNWATYGAAGSPMSVRSRRQVWSASPARWSGRTVWRSRRCR